LLEIAKDSNFGLDLRRGVLGDFSSKNIESSAFPRVEIFNKPDGAVCTVPKFIDDAITVLQNVVDMYRMKTPFTLVWDWFYAGILSKKLRAVGAHVRLRRNQPNKDKQLAAEKTTWSSRSERTCGYGQY
jgi:hypothetical protein